MSSYIFEDLERRDITNSFDLIPIAANVCNYDVRLQSDRLASSPHSLGLCALTMYFLNGEIFYNDERIKVSPTNSGLSEYLKHISFDRFIPPSREKRLSWLKQCRLWPVELSAEGVVTSGHLWHLDKEIKTTGWIDPPRVGNGWKQYGLTRYQHDTLAQLLDELKNLGICESLLCQFGHYLKRDARFKGCPSWPKSYMDTMAAEVDDAIGESRSLYIATLKKPFKAFAIFVMGEDVKSLPVAKEDFFVFTSTSSESQHVSMTVDVDRLDSNHELPLMTVTGWTNGLAFFKGVPLQKTVVHWPRAWNWRNKRRLPCIDGHGTACKSQRTH
jgi:hypothetical protein